MEGAGVRLKRAFPHGNELLFDPFLLLDDFGSDNPADYLAGFPWHPHRGIETVTYILRGAVSHGDSIGNSGTIGDGDVQWMTAGSGIVHQEMPVKTEGRTRGFQLWVNLPAAHKMMAPRYRDVRAGTIPLVAPEKGVEIRLISGKAGNTAGPVTDIVVEVEYMDVSLQAGISWKKHFPPGRSSIIYMVSGMLDLTRFPAGGIASSVESESLVHLKDSTTFETKAGPAGARFLLASGVPIGEPVAWGGPIVMNTAEELDQAFEQLENGTFIAKPGGGKKGWPGGPALGEVSPNKGGKPRFYRN